MALVLGIYEELIEAIKSFDTVLVKKLMSLNIQDAVNHTSWRFLLAVGIGILTAIFTLARVLSWLLQNQPVLIWSFFFGLICASILIVSRNIDKWSFSTIAFVVLGSICIYALIGIVPAQTPDTPWFLFMSGVIAICAMILPGISGSFILVLLGKYHYILEAVNNRDIITILLVGAGAIAGLITFVRLLNWLLSNYYDFTIALLTGLMLGSLRKIWPWKEESIPNGIEEFHGNTMAAIQHNILPSHWNNEVTIAFLLAMTGFLAVFAMNYLVSKKP